MRRLIFILMALVCLSIFPAAAAEFDLEVEEIEQIEEVEQVAGYTMDNPLPVQVVPADDEALPDYDNSGADSNNVILDVDSSEPDSPLFTGCWFVTGSDSRLGPVTLYIPADVDQSLFGVDSSGRLVYVGSDSFSAYLSGVRNNRVNFSAWSSGTYSDGTGSYYDSYTLSLVPISTNLLISDSLNSLYDIFDYLPYFIVLLGGALLVCFMRR